MIPEIVPLEDKHLEDAAALVNARYAALREDVPHLPSRYEDSGAILPYLRDLAGKAPGVAAICGGQLTGFLLGFVIPSFRGKRSIFSPEWANGADLADSRRIYQEMYARLSSRWVDDGCFVHLISTLANDRAGINGWQWLGFGLTAADAVRGGFRAYEHPRRSFLAEALSARLLRAGASRGRENRMGTRETREK